MNLEPQHTLQQPALRVVRAHAGHAGLIAAFYRGLSADARYARFFAHKPEYAPGELARLAHPDSAQEICMLALAGDARGEIVVGEARLVAIGGNGAGRRAAEGEIAVVVADDWQHRGVGRQLLCALIARARAERYTGMLAYVGASNASMLKLTRDFDFRAQRMDGGAGLKLMRKELAAAAARPDPGCRQAAWAPNDETALAAA